MKDKKPAFELTIKAESYSQLMEELSDVVLQVYQLATEPLLALPPGGSTGSSDPGRSWDLYRSEESNTLDHQQSIFDRAQEQVLWLQREGKTPTKVLLSTDMYNLLRDEMADRLDLIKLSKVGAEPPVRASDISSGIYLWFAHGSAKVEEAKDAPKDFLLVM